MAQIPLSLASDLIESIPDPDTLRRLLAESNRRSDLLRSLLRVAIRKAAYTRPDPARLNPELRHPGQAALTA